jgi:hypothetical protein
MSTDPLRTPTKENQNRSQASPCLPEANRVQNHEYIQSDGSDHMVHVIIKEEEKKVPPLQKIHIEGIL